METNKSLETKVGLFVMAGLAIIACLIISFGRIGERVEDSYKITIEFPNASGLLKGSSVLYAGAPVGRVTDHPRPIREGRAVEVDVRLRRIAKIRKDARFVIGSAGLLGDRYVDVQPVGETEPFLEDGDRAGGSRMSGFGDLTEQAKPIMERIDQIVSKINSEILTPETTVDAREAVKKLRSVLERTDNLLAEAQRGRGPLARILNDPKAADDLTSLLSNLRRNGVLFYKDDAAAVAPKAKPQTPERKRK